MIDRASTPTREAPTAVSIDPAIVEVAWRAFQKRPFMAANPKDRLIDALQAAAPLLVAGETEACAALVDAYIGVNPAAWLSNIAAAIRQRGKL